MISLSVSTNDYHTAGERFGIVSNPPVELQRDSVADRRARALKSPDAQGLRELLCFEPRGHADMYGRVLVLDDGGVHLGVLFRHEDGFSTACGDGTIALRVWAVDTGLVPAGNDGSVHVVIDVPSGRLTARVHRSGARTVAVDFVNVPDYVLGRDVPLSTSRGECRELIAPGREVEWALNDTGHAADGTGPRLSGVHGTVLHEDLGDDDGQVRQHDVSVFADGEVDRSPCGSGTCAQLAILAEQERVGLGGPTLHGSIVRSRFSWTVVVSTAVAGRPAVVL